MRRLGLRSPLFLVLCLGILCALAGRAEAAPKDDCIAAAETSQPLRAAGNLLRAREKLLSCTRHECPRAIREDCSRWLGEVESATPSLVVLAKDALGRDVVDLRVTIDDGAVVLPRLDGQPIPLDPGKHVLRYQLEGGAPAEATVVLGTGEKNRLESLSTAELARPLPLPVPRPPAPAREARAEEAAGRPLRPVPVAAYVLGGVAVAAVASWTTFGLEAEAQYSHLRSAGCAPRCSPSEVDEGKRDAIIADVAVGVAVVAAVATVWVVLARPTRTRRASSTRAPFGLDFTPRWGGATTSWTGSF